MSGGPIKADIMTISGSQAARELCDSSKEKPALYASFYVLFISI